MFQINKYKVLFLTNNPISYDLYNWLKLEKNEDVFLFKEKLSISILDELKPNIIISYNYKYIIPKDIVKFYKNKIINLHISLLPWNKGAYPNIWSYLENTPKGVTIHYIDEGIDTGDILLQKAITIDENKHTLKSSYILLHNEIKTLFKQNWENLKTFSIKPKKQKGEGSIHYKKDFEKIKFLLEPKGWNTPIKELKKKYENFLKEKEK